MYRALFVLAAACSSSPKTTTITFDDTPQRFADLATVVTQRLHRAFPHDAVSLGLHEFDGVLPDRSPAALDQLVAQLDKDRDALLAAEATTERQKLERDILVYELREALFLLRDQDAFRTNPIAYSNAINLDAYIVRAYAPATQRADAVIALCKALPGYLAQARSNLRLPMPKPWIAVALLQTKGYAEFADKDVRAELADPRVDPALDTCKQALVEHATWLERQQASGSDAFALGEQRFLKMLADTQGVEIELAALAKLADADLARNVAAIEDAARAIDPRRPVRAVILEQADDKPAPSEILEVATEQAEVARRFVLDQRIASIPSDEPALVRESPAFKRWNAAFLDAPGPFETTKLPSFYYISPPDPKWPLAEQRAYIIPRADLLFTTIHEVWPGHFLQRLHIKQHPSPIVKSFCTYSSTEGWAHYTEEMMFDAGAAGTTPQARIGMLKEALLRNARFVATIGLHTGKLSVEQAAKLFEDKAFVDPANARQQAVRGTFDPMYLAYTLGKLMIGKLRADWQAKFPGSSLADFHDRYLGYGCAPIPVIRRIMLGDDSPPL